MEMAHPTREMGKLRKGGQNLMGYPRSIEMIAGAKKLLCAMFHKYIRDSQAFHPHVINP